MSVLNKIYAGLAGLAVISCAEYEQGSKPEYSLNETIYADRLADDSYLLTFNEEGSWKVFAGRSAEAIDWEKPYTPAEGNNTLSIPNAAPTERMFFAALNGKDTLYISEREIDMENAVNFRDLGGIKTKNGKHLKWGKLFRSGELAELTKEDLVYMKTLDIQTILDLRSNWEIEEKPDMYPDGVTWKHLPIGNIEENNQDEMLKEFRNADPETFDGSKFMEEVSVEFVESKAQFRKVFDELLSEEEALPLLFHCTAGKDRTGFTSAFILYVLGVDEETILDEYSLSNYFRYEYNEDMVEKAATFYGIDHRILRPMMGVKPQWLKRGFDKIREDYGSVDEYFKNELELDSVKVATLRSKFLE